MRANLDIQTQGVGGSGDSGNAKKGIVQETCEGAIKGFEVAAMGVMLTAGGGGNIPACVTAFFICGVGGAAYGALSYAWNSVDKNSQSSVQMDVDKKESKPSVVIYGKNNTTTLFGGQREHQLHQSQAVHPTSSPDQSPRIRS